MSDIEKGMLDAQDHYLRGVLAGTKTFSRIAGQQLRQGKPEVINQVRKNLATIDQLSGELKKKRTMVQEQGAEGKKTHKS